MAGRVVDRDRGWRAFLADLRLRSRVTVGVKVGVQGPAAQDTGQRRAGEITNVLLATILEFGAPSVGIPARSVIRSTVDANEANYRRILARIERDAFRTRRPPNILPIGEKVLADMQDKIDSNVPPKLADSTIESKGDDLAWVNFGELRGSFSWAPLRGNR